VTETRKYARWEGVHRFHSLVLSLAFAGLHASIGVSRQSLMMYCNEPTSIFSRIRRAKPILSARRRIVERHLGPFAKWKNGDLLDGYLVFKRSSRPAEVLDN